MVLGEDLDAVDVEVAAVLGFDMGLRCTNPLLMDGLRLLLVADGVELGLLVVGNCFGMFDGRTRVEGLTLVGNASTF